MKFAVIIAAGLLIGGLSYMQIQNSDLQQQLQLAMSFQAQLQQQAEENTLQRLEFEQQIADLQDQLLSTRQQLSGLDAALQQAKDQIDPQYEDLLEQARSEAARETARTRRPAGGSAFSALADPDTARARAADSMPKLYSSFVNTLGIAGTERLDVMDALVDFGTERNQMLSSLLDGSLSADQASAIFGDQALNSNMEGVLTEQQLAELSQYDLLIKQDTASQIYGDSLAKSGAAISDATQDRVMEVLLNELFSEQNNYGALVAEDGSMISAYNDQLAAYERTRDRLQGELNTDQQAQLNRFLDSQSNGVDVILEVTSDANGRVSVMRARVGAEDLPQ